MQADEIWCFVGANAKDVRLEKKARWLGDVWTWVGIEKLTVSASRIHKEMIAKALVLSQMLFKMHYDLIRPKHY